MRQPKSVKALEELGRTRLSENFFLRDFHYSEIAVIHGFQNIPDDLDLASLGVGMEKNGEVVALASSADVMEHPAEAVALLVKVLDELGEELPAGSFVMSGAITAAITVQPGDHVLARYQELGSISAKFV